MKKIEISNSSMMKMAMIVVSLFLAMPSVIYLLQNKTVYRFIGMYSYTGGAVVNNILNVGIFIAIVCVFSLVYYLILKNSQKIFKTGKQMWIFIIVIAIIFMAIIPSTSLDVYSYIANRMGR